MAYARSEVCPQCCPSGGAIFRREFCEGPDGEWATHPKVCQNCGFVKTPRKPQARTMIDHHTCTAEEAKKLNASRTAAFHYFNPEGVLWGEWYGFDDLIAVAVGRGIVKSGWHLAYGTLGDRYFADQLSKLALAKKVVRRDLNVIVSMIRQNIARGRTRLNEAFAEAGITADQIAEMEAEAAAASKARAEDMERRRKEWRAELEASIEGDAA